MLGNLLNHRLWRIILPCKGCFHLCHLFSFFSFFSLFFPFFFLERAAALGSGIVGLGGRRCLLGRVGMGAWAGLAPGTILCQRVYPVLNMRAVAHAQYQP